MPEPTAPAAGSGFPAWVLLDTMARVGRRANATAVRALTSAGCAIEVSFEIADPPNLSRCFVHCPGLPPPDDTFCHPYVAGADGAFVLVNVTLPVSDGGWLFTDVFVYRAGPGAPSLRLLPRPYPLNLHAYQVGVLASGDGEHCLVVVPEQQFEDNDRMGYDVNIFSTETDSWSTKAARVASDLEWYDGDLYDNKVFSVGGSSLAWVDLRHGVLLCDGLGAGGDGEDHPEMRLVKLPPLMPRNEASFRACSDGTTPPLDPIRDVTCRDGWFRLVEMEWPESDDDGANDNTSRFPWTAKVFKQATVCSENSDWELCGTVDSGDLSPAGDSCFPGLLLCPEIWDCEEEKLTVDKVLSKYPTLDMYRDDVVYMISKVKADDTDGWVLAVDTKDQKLENVAPFSAEKLYFSRTHMQCTFSKYLASSPCSFTDSCLHTKQLL